MNVSLAKLMKLWITVVLCFGALSDALETRTNSSPPEAIADQRSSPIAAHPSSLYGGLLYDEGPSAAAAAGAKDGPHGPGIDDESFYLDQEEAAEGEEADQPKRSMGMLRLGRSRADKRPRSMAGLRLGRRSGFETGNKRSMGMLRLGRTATGTDDFDGEGEEGKRSMGMLRLGRSQGGLRRRASSSLGR